MMFALKTILQTSTPKQCHPGNFVAALNAIPPAIAISEPDVGASGSFRKVHQTTLRQALAAGSDQFWLRPLTTSLQSQHPAPTQPTHRFSCRKQGLFHGKSVDSRSSPWLPRTRLCMSYLYAPGAISETSFSKLWFFHVPR